MEIHAKVGKFEESDFRVFHPIKFIKLYVHVLFRNFRLHLIYMSGFQYNVYLIFLKEVLSEIPFIKVLEVT